MKLIEALNWRYATKRMTGEKLDDETVNLIIEAARLAPSSAGLQPIHIFVISNPSLKEQIFPIAFGQPQIIESSQLLVFTSWAKITDEALDKVHTDMNVLRNLPRATTAQTENNLKQLFSTFSEEEQYHHTAKQAHIALGVAIAAAAELGVDATPMEGFDKSGIDDLLDLRSKGLRSVLLLALGKRKIDEDWLYPLKKYRQPIEEFSTNIK
jgi:nitroreductase/dihydropteridine reductase